MKTLYDVFVNGLPKAQPRPRMAAGGHVYNPGSADEWKAAVIAAFLSCRRSETIAEPVRVRVGFYLPAPKGKKMKTGDVPHTKKPDLDNLLKAVMDAMTVAGVWKDDALVFATETSKWQTGCRTGAQITVETGV